MIMGICSMGAHNRGGFIMEFYSSKILYKDGGVKDPKGIYVNGLTHAKEAAQKKNDEDNNIEVILLFGTDGRMHKILKK